MWNYETVFRRLKNNEQGRYSITRPYEAKQITDIICNVLFHKLNKVSLESIITDCTSGVGGDTINFSFLFKQVNSIEILGPQFDLLTLNCERVKTLCSMNKDYSIPCAINTGLIRLYNCNFFDIIENIHQDVIYLDPPWGGIGYKFSPQLKIYIDKKELKDIAKTLVKLASVVFIKLPLNANLDNIDIENRFIINNKKENPSFFLIQLK